MTDKWVKVPKHCITIGTIIMYPYWFVYYFIVPRIREILK